MVVSTVAEGLWPRKQTDQPSLVLATCEHVVATLDLHGVVGQHWGVFGPWVQPENPPGLCRPGGEDPASSREVLIGDRVFVCLLTGRPVRPP